MIKNVAKSIFVFQTLLTPIFCEVTRHDHKNSRREGDIEGMFRNQGQEIPFKNLGSSLKFQNIFEPNDFLEKWYLDKLTSVSSNASVSRECSEQMGSLGLDIIERKPYAMTVLDALGKPGAGLQLGNTKWLGSFEQCTSLVGVPASNGTFTGQYCLADIQMKPNSPQAAIVLGLCVSSLCSSNDTLHYVNSALKMAGLDKQNWTVPSVQCVTDKPLSSGAIATVVIIAILGVLAVIGTTYDVIQRMMSQQELEVQVITPGERGGLIEDDDQLLGAEDEDVNADTHRLVKSKVRQVTGVMPRIILAFSVIGNGERLLSTRQGENNLGCVHGIRFISMTWIILGHSILFQSYLLDNPFTAYSVLIPRFTFQAIANATFSVDTFFFLSGLLVTYLTLKHMKKTGGSVNWLVFYLHRFLRLTPVYMFTVLFYTTLMPYLPKGPYQMALFDNPSIDACKKYWWTNLLYINNFVPESMGNECLAWGWFLANDMQFHIISPIVLYLLYRWKYAGLSMIGALCLANFIVTGTLARIWGIMPVNGVQGDNHTGQIYQHFYHRIASYMVGMAVGFLLVEFGRRVRLNKILTILGWCVAASINLAVLYGLFYYFRHKEVKMNPDLAAFYTAVSRFAWCVGLGWVTFACVKGLGGPVNTLLSWSAFIPLGRLTYCAYLVHPIVIEVAITSSKTPIHYTDFNMIYFFLGSLVLSYCAAFMVSMMLEAPMMQLEKIIFPRETPTVKRMVYNSDMSQQNYA